MRYLDDECDGAAVSDFGSRELVGELEARGYEVLPPNSPLKWGSVAQCLAEYNQVMASKRAEETWLHNLR